MAPKAKPKNTNQCQNLMLTALTAYYKKNIYNRKELYNIINGDTNLSLRLIDWFVTHYARVNSVIYWIDDKNGSICDTNPTSTIKNTNDSSVNNLRKFNLYLDYRAQLQSYTKMFFDPFRRYSRISFVLENEPLLSIETTVGQLNFFRWALQNNVVEYIKNNIAKIEESMANFQKQNQNKPVTDVNIQNNVTINENVENTDINKNVRKTKLKTKQICHTHTITRVPCLVYFD